MIEVFRGPKCAPETYSKNTGPCGEGDHNSGYYQWGLGGHHDEDAAGIFASDRTSISVFEVNDGYKLPANLQARLDAEAHGIEAEAQAKKAEQEVLASVMQDHLRKAGFHVNVLCGSEYGEIVIISDLFDEDLGRVRFLSAALPGLRPGLCKVGFTNVTLKTGALSIGDNYQVGCKSSS
jgi:hypothetical protein